MPKDSTPPTTKEDAKRPKNEQELIDHLKREWLSPRDRLYEVKAILEGGSEPSLHVRSAEGIALFGSTNGNGADPNSWLEAGPWPPALADPGTPDSGSRAGPSPADDSLGGRLGDEQPPEAGAE